MASSMFRFTMPSELGGLGKALASGGAQSRSTSAGSVPSEGQGSVDQRSFTQEYHQDMRGLPEYDYPTPWSINQLTQLPEIDYPVPLVVKNTFVDFDVWRPPSLEEFYKERQVQSCPVSAIGLEDVCEPADDTASLVAAAKLVASETALREAGIRRRTRAKATPLPMDHLLPTGLLDDISIEDDGTESLFSSQQQQPPAFDVTWQSSVSPIPLEAPPTFNTCSKSHMTSPSLYSAVLDNDRRSQALKQPVVLDLANALCSPLPAVQTGRVAEQPAFSADHLATPGFGAELGSPECPTIGSRSHWLSTCKPCAFFHTRGCDNGARCPFCHLCDKGEKKKRAKDKRAGQHRSQETGCY